MSNIHPTVILADLGSEIHTCNWVNNYLLDLRGLAGVLLVRVCESVVVVGVGLVGGVHESACRWERGKEKN